MAAELPLTRRLPHSSETATEKNTDGSVKQVNNNTKSSDIITLWVGAYSLLPLFFLAVLAYSAA